MEPLSISFIGWFFTVAAAVALAAGAAVVWLLFQSGKLSSRYLDQNVWHDLLLAGIWMLGLAGGLGVLNARDWGRFLVEFFCWVLMVLMLGSSGTRLLAMHRERPDAKRADWIGAISSALVIVLPVVALCVATIITLRSDNAWRAFTGG